MRRVGLVLVAVTLLASLGVRYRVAHVCGEWQDQYKRFLYAESQKNSPVIYTPNMIDDVIGSRPDGCARPATLSTEDRERFEDEGVGPNEFARGRAA